MGETPEKKLPIQKILFGSPGTGKSYKVNNEIAEYLKIKVKTDNTNYDFNKNNGYDESYIIHTIFHPEYKYGDFMGKLLPHTEGGNITYRYYAGIFMKALAKAYRNILDDNEKNSKNVLLIIDEINRGNASAIFGSIFQLLDRNNNGWSSYEIDISDLEFEALLDEIGFECIGLEKDNNKEYKKFKYNNCELNMKDKTISIEELNFLAYKKIKLPPNLSIVATMNTSDESIYYMDSAFKRRWDWEYVPVDGEIGNCNSNVDNDKWKCFRKTLNKLLKNHSAKISKIEDKLIGEYFLKEPYTCEKIRNKLMFFLWDSVFDRDKTPLNELLNLDKLDTFGDFSNKVDEFVKSILADANFIECQNES